MGPTLIMREDTTISHDTARPREAGLDRGPGAPIMLYDGLCGFCDRTVQLVLRFDRKGAMRFATLQGTHARQMLSRHPSLHGVDSLVIVEPATVNRDGRVHVRSDAVLAIARYLGGAWRTLSVLRVIPRPLRDWAYDQFAKRRYRIFGKFDACPILPPEVRARFID